MIADVPELAAIVGRFAIDGRLTDAAPLGRGHIHDSYVLGFEGADGARRYVLQRINQHVFRDPAAVMVNVSRVTRHLHSKLPAPAAPALERRCLTLVPSLTGLCFDRDARGGWWRVYHYIENSVTHQSIDNLEQARSAAHAYGAFQRALHDLPVPRLAETIPDFHVTPRRLERLEQAIAQDTHGRAAKSRAEIELARSRRPLADALLALHRSGALPERIVHNDTKLNNVLFDVHGDDALCVVDLDTVMPGLAPYDFGDLVRSCALAQEDRPERAGFDLDLGLFEALLRGYLEGTSDMLSPAERTALPVACRLIAYELGMRFLTDYLQGDPYFKIDHDDHNLERARTQLALMQAMERRDAAMRRLVDRLSREHDSLQPR
jgi:Ser/Thr protein kinase RdoA (MazF antagonist)